MFNTPSGSEIDPENVSLPENLFARLTTSGQDVKRNLDEFLSTLEMMEYLELEPAKLITWAGHPTAIAKIRVSHWRSSPLTTTSNGRLTFPAGEPNFDIHFEIRVLLTQPKISLSLRYEPFPYLSQKELREQLEASALETYYIRRSEFVSEFERVYEVPGFTVWRNVVQIGKADYDCTDRSVAEVASWMESMIDNVTMFNNITQCGLILDRRKATSLRNSD
jgi:hypothetical protein